MSNDQLKVILLLAAGSLGLICLLAASVIKSTQSHINQLESESTHHQACIERIQRQLDKMEV